MYSDRQLSYLANKTSDFWLTRRGCTRLKIHNSLLIKDFFINCLHCSGDMLDSLERHTTLQHLTSSSKYDKRFCHFFLQGCKAE